MNKSSRFECGDMTIVLSPLFSESGRTTWDYRAELDGQVYRQGKDLSTYNQTAAQAANELLCFLTNDDESLMDKDRVEWDSTDQDTIFTMTEQGRNFQLIASEWHNGQASALYAYSCTAIISPALIGEIQHSIELASSFGVDIEDLNALLIHIENELEA